MNGAPLVERVNEIQGGELRPETYVAELLERVDDRDREIRAFVPEADRAQRLRNELNECKTGGREQPALYGIPVGVKDIFHVRGMETAAGAEVPADVLTGEEADVICRLRRAGAIVLGKTVTAEFAYFEPGPTRNPHDRDRTPGGSSSGSAASVSAGMCPLALGTQTAGSVIRPAAFCGTVGVKPSHGRVPTTGVIPFARSLDQVGYFTRDIRDAQLAGSVLVDDWTAVDISGTPTLGVPAEEYLVQAAETGYSRFQDQCDVLEEEGFDVRDASGALEDIDRINADHRTLMEAEGALTHHEWYEAYSDRYSDTLSTLIERGRAVGAEELEQVRRERIRLREDLVRTMVTQGVDVLISPAAPGPAPTGIDDTGDPVMNVPWTYAGLPSMTIPVGTSSAGLPIGLQCVARFGADEELLAWGGVLADVFER